MQSLSSYGVHASVAVTRVTTPQSCMLYCKSAQRLGSRFPDHRSACGGARGPRTPCAIARMLWPGAERRLRVLPSEGPRVRLSLIGDVPLRAVRLAALFVVVGGSRRLRFQKVPPGGPKLSGPAACLLNLRSPCVFLRMAGLARSPNRPMVPLDPPLANSLLGHMRSSPPPREEPLLLRALWRGVTPKGRMQCRAVSHATKSWLGAQAAAGAGARRAAAPGGVRAHALPWCIGGCMCWRLWAGDD